jgi:hypothetical protein
VNLTVGDKQNPWVHLSASNTSLKLDVTVCYSNLGAAVVSSAVTGGQMDNREPSLVWNTTTGRYDTSSVRKLLAGKQIVPYLSPHDRRILSLSTFPPESEWNSTVRAMELVGEDPINGTTSSHTLSLILGIPEAISIDTYGRDARYNDSVRTQQRIGLILCAYCFPPTAQTALPLANVHRSYVSIFQDIYSATESMATALQALHTLVFQSAYYDFLPQFDEFNNATASFYQPALTPMQIKGLVIVWICVGIHLIAVFTVVALYLFQDHISIVGDFWQTFAQAMNGDVGNVMSMASTASDKEMERYLKVAGISDTAYGLVYDDNTRCCAVVRKVK